MQMLVDDIGDVTITNDGATILKMLEVEHAAAKVLECAYQCWIATFLEYLIVADVSIYLQVLVELAELQDKEVGDGTTSVVIFAAELLKVSCNLLSLQSYYCYTLLL